jgi:Zn-finger nucleic acid-binding protein
MYPPYGPGNVVIDCSTRCDLIWLDFREMRQIVDAPGKDRGSRHPPRIDESYVREGVRRDEDDDWISSRNAEGSSRVFHRRDVRRLTAAAFLYRPLL